jgi:hypothetical protein
MSSGIASAASRAGAGSGRRITTRSPPATRAAGSLSAAPSRVTAPASISAFSRERDRASSSGTAAANALSSRAPGGPPSTTSIWRTSDMATDPESDELDPPEPRRLRQLRWLVNALMLTLIAGVITVTALLVIRLAPLGQVPALPEAISLPAGERAEAVTMGRDWIAVVTADEAGTERIRVLDRATGAERAVTRIEPAPE